MWNNEDLYKKVDELNQAGGTSEQLQDMINDITANYFTYAPYEITIPKLGDNDQTESIIEDFFIKEFDLDFTAENPNNYVPAVIDSWVLKKVIKLEINEKARNILKAVIKVMEAKPSLIFAAVYREN
jgi:hypothetical protein